MNFRVVSPRMTWIIYLGIELFAVPFFFLLLFDIGPYQVYDSMPGARLIQLLLLCVALVLPLYFEFYNFGSLRLQIDETGVTYKSRQEEYHLSWNEVKRISINPDAAGQLSTGMYVCFFAEEKPQAIIARSGFNSRAFGLQYRKGLPEAIAKYCDRFRLRIWNGFKRNTDFLVDNDCERRRERAKATEHRDPAGDGCGHPCHRAYHQRGVEVGLLRHHPAGVSGQHSRGG